MGGPAESWADAELASADSELSLLGRKVAQRVQDVAGVRTFYYLLQSYSEPGAERCPECDSGWRCEPAWHGRFEYRCDDCLLLADIGAMDASARSPTQANGVRRKEQNNSSRRLRCLCQQGLRPSPRQPHDSLASQSLHSIAAHTKKGRKLLIAD